MMTPLSLPAVDTLLAELTTTYSQGLAKDQQNALFTFEPLFLARASNSQSFSLFAAVNRPLGKYENFAVPWLASRFSHSFRLAEKVTSSVDASVYAMDFHRWSQEGYMLRPTLRADISAEVLRGLKFTFRIAPYIFLNAYRQTTAGIDKPRYGITERFLLEYLVGRTTLGASLTIGQRYTALWKNDYGTNEWLEYQLDNTLALGMGHEILGSFVSESTGRASPLRVFNDRESRFSVYAVMKI